MNRFLGVMLVAGAGAVAASGQNNLRLYLSTQGWLDSRPAPQPVPTEALDMSTPVLQNGGRLYLWAQALDGSAAAVWGGIGLNLEIDGGFAFISRRFFKPSWFDPANQVNVNRWNNAFQGGPPDELPPGTREISANLVAIGIEGEYGVRRTPRPDGFITNDVIGGHVLLAYVDIVPFDVPGEAELWLKVGAAGVSRRSGNALNDRVFFGFGDAGLRGNQFGERSTLPDAIIVPEPAGLFAVASGLLVLLYLRRRRGSRSWKC